MMRVRIFHGYESLPPDYDAVFADSRTGSLFRRRAWLENFQRNGLRPGDRLRLFGVEADTDGAPLALLPALYSRFYSMHPQARVIHFLQPDEQPYLPLLAREDTDPAEVIDAVVEFLRANPKSYDVVRASPLDPQAPFATAFLAALRRTGHPLQSYEHIADRFEAVAGQAFADYRARRPRDLRETLDRTGRLLLSGGRALFDLNLTPEQLAAGWTDFRPLIQADMVAAQQQPATLLPSNLLLAAQAGALQLGCLHLDGVPVALQFWLVDRGAAHCMRIWSAEKQAYPTDDILTELMALCLIDGNHVAELDFGGISDEFARSWAPAMRRRIGVAAFNPRTWRGIKGAVRHVGIQRLKAFPKWLSRSLGGRRR
jgi:CelD/BcsL family acetyltransferase involved in cellulose biosynthesis